MTPQLETAIAATQPLSLLELTQLITILASTLHKIQVLEAENATFWSNPSLEELDAGLVQKQSLPVFLGLHAVASDLWPEEESVDDFLDFLQEQRQLDMAA